MNGVRRGDGRVKGLVGYEERGMGEERFGDGVREGVMV